MASSIILTANTQQAVAELQKLDESQRAVGKSLNQVSAAAETAGSFWDTTTAKLGAAAIALGGAAASVIGFANASHQAAIESSDLWDMLQTRGGKNIVDLQQQTGFLLDAQTLVAAQNRLVEGDLKLTSDQVATLGKTAVAMADQFGGSESEILEKLSTVLSTGKKLDRWLSKHGVNMQLTGDKARDAALVIAELNRRFSDTSMAAGNASERLNVYENQMKMIKAEMYNASGKVGLGEWLSMSWKGATEAIMTFVATGKTVDQWAQQIKNKEEIRVFTTSIDDMIKALDSYTGALDQARSSGLTWQGTMQDVADMHENNVTAVEKLKAKYAEWLGMDFSAIKDLSLGEIQRMAEIVNKTMHLSKVRHEQYQSMWKASLALKHSQQWEAAAAVEAERWAYHLAKTREQIERIGKTADRLTGGVISGFARNFTGAFERLTDLMESKKEEVKVDQTLVKLKKDLTDATITLQAATISGDAETARTAQEKLVNTQKYLAEYRRGGENALAFAEKVVASEKAVAALREKTRQDEISENDKQHQLSRTRYSREIQDQQELFDLRYKDVQAQGAAGLEVERIDKLREQAQIRYARELRAGHTVTAGVYAAEIKDLVSQKAAIMESVVWQRELKKTLDERAAVLPYLSLAGESPIAADLKQKEFDLSVALLKNDKERAEALKAQIVEMKGQANAYGELQNRFNSWGQGWELTKKLTESVFRSSTEALLMSNAELKKAGKTRSQMIMESLKNTLKAAAIDNAVKGGTRLAEAIAATAIGNPSAAGLYAASAKHFAVALAAGGAAALARVQGGGNASTAKTEKTSSVAGTAAANSQINYVYNFSNSMMLSNPDALVRSFKGLEKSYAERKAS